MFAKRLIPIICIMCLALVGGCAGMKKSGPDDQAKIQDTLTPERHLELAGLYQEQGRTELAIIHYNKYLAKKPGDTAVTLKRGLAFFKMGKNTDAMKDLASVLKKDPANTQASEALGIISFENGLTDRAEKLLAVAAKDNNRWRANAYMGLIHSKRGDYPQAMQSFETAMAIRPNNPNILNNMGVACVMTGQLDKALEQFVQAVKYGASKAKTYNNLGMLLVKKDQLDKALQAFMNAGEPAKAYNNLGYALMILGHYDKAVPYLEKAIELSPKFYVRAFENLKRARMSSGLIHMADSAPLTKATPVAPAKAEPAAETAPAIVPQVVAPVINNISFNQQQPNITGINNTKDSASAIVENYYGVHTTSWKTEEKAISEVKQALASGTKARVVRVELDSGAVWYRVVLGAFKTRDEAKDFMSSLKKPRDARVVKFNEISADKPGRA